MRKSDTNRSFVNATLSTLLYVKNNSSSLSFFSQDLNAMSDDGNLEDVLIELNKFSKNSSSNVNNSDGSSSLPPVLDEYLSSVARTGALHFPWPQIKPVFRAKLRQVMDAFERDLQAPPPPTSVPNVDAFSFADCREKVLTQLECFSGAPFTVQRLCELLTAPRRHYRRSDKFMRALEKNMLVVSTVEAKSQKQPERQMVNGDHNSSECSDGGKGEPEKSSAIDTSTSMDVEEQEEERVPAAVAEDDKSPAQKQGEDEENSNGISDQSKFSA